MTYEALFPSGHAPAFPAGSRHLARVPVFADAINATLSAFKEAGMKTYLVSFEPSFPAGLDQRINISRFNSPDMEHFLRTKFCELRERIPALDGVTIYAADDWVSGSGCDTTSELTSGTVAEYLCLLPDTTIAIRPAVATGRRAVQPLASSLSGPSGVCRLRHGSTKSTVILWCATPSRSLANCKHSL